MSDHIPGICAHCGKPIERVSHPDDSPPAMWVHVGTRLASCGLYAAPMEAGGDSWLEDLARAGENAAARKMQGG